MARTITITLTYDLNEQVQVGDLLFYQANGSTTVTELGTIATINFTTKIITVSISDITKAPSQNDYVFFAKNNKAHQADIIGYFAEAVMRNNSTEEAELFQLSAEIAESSK
jgi:hypothetical protein